MKAKDSLVKALLSRGEVEVTMASASKFRKFTRRYMGQRDESGNLRPSLSGVGISATFWFVSVRNGSLRTGRTSTESKKVKKEVRELLLKEGTAK